MKHILFAFLVVFAIGFTSCEKDPDPQLLSEFVIGTWQSQVVDLGDVDTDIYFLVDIEANQYTLSMTDGVNTVDLPAAGYTVDNEANVITIDQPQFPGDDPSDETVSFTVTWVEGQNTMLWTPIEGSDAPSLQWTRGD